MSDLIIAPATRGSFGVVALTSGPPNPSDRGPALRRDLIVPNRFLREGMIALTRCVPRDLARAERCFNTAHTLLTYLLGKYQPKVAFALDRIGLTCHLAGREAEAEDCYLASLAALDGAPPSPWTEVTLLNLAMLYGSQGRDEERDVVLERFRQVQGFQSVE